MNDIPAEYRVEVAEPGVSGPDVAPAVPSAAWIRDWLGSAEYQAEFRAFENTPAHSLLSTPGRAFLYHLVRATRPETVLEVGTYFAGTSEVLARALHRNAKGTLITTDPFGGERCPFIFRQWPAALRKHVRFHPLNSMALAQRLADDRTTLDIAFIDGCHDYEYVLFDALAFAKLVRPGGVMVLDNAEQPGVFRACGEFLRHYPDWVELGQAMQADVPDNPFALTLDRSSVPGTTFLVLRAPEFHAVSPRGFLSTGQVSHAADRCGAVRISPFEAPGPGRLHVETCFRAFGQTLPLELRSLSTLRFGGDDGVAPTVITLDRELRVPADAIEPFNRYTVEVGLYWNPDDGRSSLRLRAHPEALTDRP